MKTDRTRECPYCHKKVNAQGYGGHLRLKHGIKEDIIKTQVERKFNMSSTQVDVKSTQVKPELNVELTHVERELNAGGNVSSTQVIRPSDYVKKKETIIEKKITPAFTTQPAFLSEYWKAKATQEDSLSCWYCHSIMDMKDERIPQELIYDPDDKRVPPHQITGWCKRCDKTMRTREYYFEMK